MKLKEVISITFYNKYISKLKLTLFSFKKYIVHEKAIHITYFINILSNAFEKNHPIVEEADTFLNHKQAYLKQKQTNDDEMRIFNFESNELQSNLNKELKKLKI